MLFVLTVRDCSSSPCVHGTCRHTSLGFSCTCDPGYKGDTCNTGKFYLTDVR